jgi:hypothetical protein
VSPHALAVRVGRHRAVRILLEPTRTEAQTPCPRLSRSTNSWQASTSRTSQAIRNARSRQQLAAPEPEPGRSYSSSGTRPVQDLAALVRRKHEWLTAPDGRRVAVAWHGKGGAAPAWWAPGLYGRRSPPLARECSCGSPLVRRSLSTPERSVTQCRCQEPGMSISSRPLGAVASRRLDLLKGDPS